MSKSTVNGSVCEFVLRVSGEGEGERESVDQQFSWRMMAPGSQVMEYWWNFSEMGLLPAERLESGNQEPLSMSGVNEKGLSSRPIGKEKD